MPSVIAEPPLPLDTHTDPARFSPSWCWAYALQQFSVISFFGLGLMTGVISVPASLFGRWIPHAAGQGFLRGLIRFWLGFSVRMGVFEIRFSEAEALRQMRGAILAPNHPTMMDAIILLSVAQSTVCIMRASLMKNPCIGGGARLAGFVTNDSGPALIRQGVERIQRGENLLIFPEGTRTGSEPVNSFKNGFALIAAKSDAPIQTIFIERETRYLGKGVSLFASTPLPIRYRLHLGESFRTSEGESPQKFVQKLEDYFRDRLINTGEAIQLKTPVP